jgi:threonine synthase
MVCGACGWKAADDDPSPFRCWHAGRGDDVDHLLIRRLDLGAVAATHGAHTFEQSRAYWQRIFLSEEPNPFVRYRVLLHAYHVARAGGMSDDDYVALVRQLDAAVAQVDGTGFRTTPFATALALGKRLDFPEGGAVWVKDETCNVSGSHKGRHLMGLAIWLAVSGRLRSGQHLAAAAAPLAIASCGNAALAAAVVAKAASRALHVYIPQDAHPAVVDRLRALDARLTVCPRQPGVPGDPAYLAFLGAVDVGAVPFTCQGNQNGLTIEGGMTLAWEMVSELLRVGGSLDRVFLQVGGGALASAVIQGFEEAERAGALARRPAFHAVQTTGGHPLQRAYERTAERLQTRLERDGVGAARERLSPAERAEQLLRRAPDLAIAEELDYAAVHRSEFMWPWQPAPRSIATGILDDETYDWMAVVRGMLQTGGWPVVVGEDILREANALAREATGIAVDPTGSAGLAGCVALLPMMRSATSAAPSACATPAAPASPPALGVPPPAPQRIAVVFTGRERDRPVAG